MRRLLRALAGAVAALALFGAAPSGEPYVIDVILPLTGNSAFAGETHANAIKVYEQVANETGGIHGRPVHFEIHDDQSSPVVAVQLLDQLQAKNAKVVLGSSSIASCAAEASILADTTLEFCLSPGLSPKQPNVFASSIAIDHLVPAHLKFFRERGYTRIAVIVTTDATGQATDKLLAAALKKPENASLQVVAYEHFNPTEISLSAIAARVKAGDPQGIIVFATGSAFGTVLRSLHDAGVDVPVTSSAVNMNERQLGEYAAFLPKELTFNTALYVAPEQVKAPSMRAAIDQFYAAYRKAGLEPNPESGLSWDPAKIVVAALRALPLNADGKQITDYISQLHDFAGVSGIYDFRLGDHHGLTDQALLFVKWVPATATFAAASKPGGFPLTL